MGLPDMLRAFLSWLTPKMGERGTANRRMRSVATDPDALRPVGPPISLGPKATMVEASAQGHSYLLKKWTDLPPNGRRELLRLLEQRRELGAPRFLEIVATGERTQGRQTGYVYCIQEHRPRTLKAWLKGYHAPIPLEVAADVVRQIATALQETHDKGVVHGNLGPETIYVSTPEGPDSGAVCLDLVRSTGMELSHNPSYTIAEVFPTGRSYLAPETLLGNTADEQSDLYILGIIAYEIFTRKLPFGDEGASTTMKVRSMLNAQMQPLTRHRPDIPTRWEAGITKLLSKDRKLRYRTAEEFLRTVETEL